MFLTSQPLATLHPQIKPSKPNICLKMPSWTLREGPRRAQDSPRWAQDGPKEGRHTTGNPRILILGALLGPSWATSALQKTMVFLRFFASFQVPSPPDLKLLPSCKLPEASLVDLKLYFALLGQSSSQLGIQVAPFKPSNPQQDLQRSILQAF